MQGVLRFSEALDSLYQSLVKLAIAYISNQ